MTKRLLALLLATAVLPAATAFAQAPANNAPNADDARLRALYEEEFAWRLREDAQVLDPETGRPRPDDHFPRVDAASQTRRLGYWTEILRRLDAIPLADLSAAERTNAQVFRAVIDEYVSDARWRTYETPFNSDSFFWTVAPSSGFRTAEDYRRYLGRLRDIPRYFAEQTANMRAGLARGFTIPRVTLTGRDNTIEPYLIADTTNPLYRPFERMPAGMPTAEQERMRAEALAAIRDTAIPAYRTLLTFLRQDYFPNARTTLGASQLPDGAAFYQAQIARFTTLALTPRQIHDTGLSEVARIRAEMEQVMRRANFTGSFAQFIHFLRTDPQFYARTPEELLGYASYVVMRANGQLRNAFGRLPRFRHGIVPVPAAIAAVYTGGRGGLENCMFNTLNLPQRPLYTLPALALHECTPGHSFQAALSLEGPELPGFRRDVYFSGYGEGWGLYVEWLGTTMGIYRTPYEDFGRLTYEMWRAARLVIDTGLHAYGWTRERALAYLRDNTALSEHEITTEVDRYIAWPGQAVAYKLGELQIRRHRAEAEAALGDRFDQRGFHDFILALGAVPLPVLEERMRAWIAEQRAAR